MPDPLDRLGSLGEPRPLSEALRARLEDALIAADVRPLSGDQDASLTAALRDPVGELLAGLDNPRPLPPRMRSRAEQVLVRRPRWRPVALATGVAAAATGVLVLALPHDTGRPPGAALPSPSTTALIGSGTAGAAQTTGTTGGGPAVAAPAAPAAPPTATSPPVPASGSVAGAFVPDASPSPTRSPAPRRAPTVDGISPTAGPAGTWVTLTGRDLTPTTQVTFGGVRAGRVEQLSATRVRALAPPHVPGPVDVVLTTTAGSSSPQRYLYLPA
jgi:hypothetical protein